MDRAVSGSGAVDMVSARAAEVSGGASDGTGRVAMLVDFKNRRVDHAQQRSEFWRTQLADIRSGGFRNSSKRLGEIGTNRPVLYESGRVRVRQRPGHCPLST